jgi:hypothetical protein
MTCDGGVTIAKLPTRGLAALKEQRCRGLLQKMKLMERSAVEGYVIITEAEFRRHFCFSNAKTAPAAAV